MCFTVCPLHPHRAWHMICTQWCTTHGMSDVSLRCESEMME